LPSDAGGALRSAVLGLCIGLFTSFVNSYGYAVSGFTTSEISVVFIPLLIYALSRALGVSLSREELALATAMAVGVDITTTLTSGMYITYGFLKYVASVLSGFGISVRVPPQLFSGARPIDLEAMPTYVALACASASGVLIAYALRMHYIEKERLLYPFGMAAALIARIVRRIGLGNIVALLCGAGLQLAYLELGGFFKDLTPYTSSVLPGSVLAVSLNPLVAALLFMIPLGSLRTIAAGSLATYLLLLPAALALCGVAPLSAPTYDSSLFSYSTIVASLLLGSIAATTVYYLARHRSALARSMSIAMRMGPEKTSFIAGLAIMSAIAAVAYAVDPRGFTRIAPLIPPLIATHLALTLTNLRIVGEAGMGSQAVLPLVTFEMYVYGCRSAGLYAALDPYTGIPMPQVVGGTAMNVMKMAQLSGARSSRCAALMCLGIALGSIATFLYGNALVDVFGLNSPRMPLVRWIPTVVWMAAIYSGSVSALYLKAVALGVAVGIVVIVLEMLRGLPALPFLVGITLPPDIGLLALAVAAIKSVVVRLGVEVQEASLRTAAMFLCGCGIGLATYMAAVW